MVSIDSGSTGLKALDFGNWPLTTDHCFSVCGVLLAAGESTRMGGKKLLLPFGDTTVAGAALRALAVSQVAEVVVVLGHEAERVRQHLLSVVSGQPSRNSEHRTRNLKFVVNSHYQEGMFSSVLCGLQAANASPEGFLVSLADMPGVSAEVIDTLLAEFRQAGKGITVPTYQGRRGHPLLFHQRYEDEIRHLDPQVGLQGLLSRHPDEVLEVLVDCPGVVRDIDYWEDYLAQRP